MASWKLNQSSQVILDRLDNLLKECPPQDRKVKDHEDLYGVDYTARYNELKKVIKLWPLLFNSMVHNGWVSVYTAIHCMHII